MKKWFLIAGYFLFWSMAGWAQSSFFHTSGQQILDGNNEVYVAHGLVLSGWLIPEAYGLKLDEVHDRHINAYTDIRANIRALLGNDADAKLFWDTYTSNYVTTADLAAFKAIGFNSVRLPFNYRLLMSVTNEPDVFLEEGFQFLDNVIQLCKTNGLSVLLDMHACPGGQSHDAYADPEHTYWSEDGNGVWREHGVAVLWESNAQYYAATGRTPEANKQRTINLWREIARRYVNEPAILGYELINEPYFYTSSGVTTNDLRDLFIRITSAIREEDTNHIVFVEGNIFAEFIDGLTPPWDDNMALAFHRYWRETGYEDGVVQSYLDARSTYNVPLLMTESGENSNPWVYEINQLMESNGIGGFWWGFKKVDVNSVVYHVDKTEDYQYVIDNWRDAPAVDEVRVKGGLMDLANRVSTTHCTYIPGYFEALFDPQFPVLSRPFADHVIPGVVYFSDYDVGNEGIAYHDSRYKNTTYEGEGWNLGWTYRSDGVDLSTCGTGNQYNVAYIDSDEWVKYTVRILHAGVYDLDICAATPYADRRIQFFLDGVDLTGAVMLRQGTGWDDWQHVIVTNLTLPVGPHVLKVLMLTNDFDLSGMSFELSNRDFVDRDGDQIDDHWEIRYGGDLDPAANADQDGLNNLQEYFADTDPTNAASSLVVAMLLPNEPGKILEVSSSTGRLYTLQYRASLLSGGWSNLQSNVAGDGGMLSLSDTNAFPSGYYRVGVSRP
ncbi:MAG: cellulase family glycosylhydrolase [Kiritimatiellae bacterium]|nr:cellulase family glycosylhydrolase [Kiritimatiellia bacterium]